MTSSYPVRVEQKAPRSVSERHEGSGRELVRGHVSLHVAVFVWPRVLKSRGRSDSDVFLFLQKDCSASFLTSHVTPGLGTSYRVPQWLSLTGTVGGWLHSVSTVAPVCHFGSRRVTQNCCRHTRRCIHFHAVCS